MDKTENGTAFVNGNGKVHFGSKVEYSTKVINQMLQTMKQLRNW